MSQACDDMPLVDGVQVQHGSLIEMHISATDSFLQSLDIDPAADPKAFLAEHGLVKAWILRFDVVRRTFRAFVFCFSQSFDVPVAHVIRVCSPISHTMTLEDFMSVYRHCGPPSSRVALLTPLREAEKETLTSLCTQSKMLQLTKSRPDFSHQQLCTHCARYRDLLLSLDALDWHRHVFQPDPSMVPSWMRSCW